MWRIVDDVPDIELPQSSVGFTVIVAAARRWCSVGYLGYGSVRDWCRERSSWTPGSLSLSAVTG